MGWVYSQVAYNSRISDSGNKQRLWVSVPEGVFFVLNLWAVRRYPSSEGVRCYRIIAISFEPKMKRGESCLNYIL